MKKKFVSHFGPTRVQRNPRFKRTMQRCWVWLGCFADGSQRHRRSAQAEGGDDCRHRRQVPPDPWLRERLVSAGGPGFDESVLYALGGREQVQATGPECAGHGTPIVALLRLSASGCVHNSGPLTRWSQEASLQREYYSHPLDDYELHIDGVFTLPQAHAIQHKWVRRVGSGGIGRITCTQPLFTGHWGEGDGADGVEINMPSGRVVSASHVVSGGTTELRADSLPVLLLPWPLAFLVLQKQWSRILLLVRWHGTLNEFRHRNHGPGPLPQWPPEGSIVWQHGGEDDSSLVPSLCDAPPLTDAALERLSDIVRGWVPALLEGAPPSLCAREEILSVVTVLDRWRFSWRQAMGMLNVSGGGTRFRHNSAKLLDCIRLSKDLSGGPSSLVNVVAQSLALALPEFLRQPFLSHITQPNERLREITPSPTLIQRHEVSLDVALMLLARQSSATDCIRVGWSDSSPLAGYDWLWSQFHEIPLSKVVQCHRAVSALQQGTEAFVRQRLREQEAAAAADTDADAEDDSPDPLPAFPLPEWVEPLRVLSSSVREHIAPPVALGSGHRSLADKACSEVFKWMLENPSGSDLSMHGMSFVAHCSDMGTELGLPDFELSGSVRSLLPEWLRQDQIPADIESQEPAAQGNGARPPDDDIDGPTMADDSSVANPVVRPMPPHVPRPLMPKALTIAGLQHVINNLCSDIHTEMSHWETFYSHLKALEALLRVPERRQRYVWCCIHLTPFQGFSGRFERFRASLYENRWHEILNFLRHLEPLLPILARTWDADKYVRGVAADGVMRPEQARAERVQQAGSQIIAFDPQKVTAAVRSSLFHAYAAMALKIEQVPSALAQASEGCPCHRALFQFQDATPGVKTCPMAGKLLPELCCGDLDTAHQQLWSVREADLYVLPLPPGLPPLTTAEMGTLLTDFRKGLLGVYSHSHMCARARSVSAIISPSPLNHALKHVVVFCKRCGQPRRAAADMGACAHCFGPRN